MIQEDLRRHAGENPDKPAVICENTQISLRELDFLSNKLAYSLALTGIKPADKVSFLMKNTVEFPLLYYALLKLGAVGVPLNTRYSASELEFVLNHAEARTLIYDVFFAGTIEKIRPNLRFTTRFIINDSLEEAGFRQLVKQGRDLPLKNESGLRDEMIHFYTSGTTADPKGVILTWGNCLSSSDMWIKALELHERDMIFVTTPLWHCSAATAFMLSAGKLGSTLVLLPDYKTEEALRVIQDKKVTFMWLVPSMMIMMQESPMFETLDLSSLEKVLCGGAPLGLDVVKRWERILPKVKILNGYAQTEGATAATILKDEFLLTKPHSIGKPLSGRIRIKVVSEAGTVEQAGQVGEILIKGPNVMKGYFKNPSLTSKTLHRGWLHTGDLGYFDEEGFLYYAGRKKDLIIRGGENIFPEEIENVLARHPGILESSVIGIPDRILGEVVMAVIVPKRNMAPEAPDLIEHCRKYLADFKIPKYIEIVQELPKNPTGKILKKVLREQYKDSR